MLIRPFHCRNAVVSEVTTFSWTPWFSNENMDAKCIPKTFRFSVSSAPLMVAAVTEVLVFLSDGWGPLPWFKLVGWLKRRLTDSTTPKRYWKLGKYPVFPISIKPLDSKASRKSTMTRSRSTGWAYWRAWSRETKALHFSSWRFGVDIAVIDSIWALHGGGFRALWSWTFWKTCKRSRDQ